GQLSPANGERERPGRAQPILARDARNPRNAHEFATRHGQVEFSHRTRSTLCATAFTVLARRLSRERPEGPLSSTAAGAKTAFSHPTGALLLLRQQLDARL